MSVYISLKQTLIKHLRSTLEKIPIVPRVLLQKVRCVEPEHVCNHLTESSVNTEVKAGEVSL